MRRIAFIAQSLQAMIDGRAITAKDSGEDSWQLVIKSSNDNPDRSPTSRV
jgi:hypothetical protein